TALFTLRLLPIGYQLTPTRYLFSLSDFLGAAKLRSSKRSHGPSLVPFMKTPPSATKILLFGRAVMVVLPLSCIQVTVLTADPNAVGTSACRSTVGPL